MDEVKQLLALIYEHRLFVTFTTVTIAVLLYFARIGREKRNANTKATDERRTAEEAQRIRAEEIQRRSFAIKSAAHSQFVTAIGAVTDRLNPRDNPISVYNESLRTLPQPVLHFAELLASDKRRAFDEAWKQYQQLGSQFPPLGSSRPSPSSSLRFDFSEGIDFLRAALERLRSFADDNSHLTMRRTGAD